MKKRKNNIWLTIGVIVICVFLLWGGAGSYSLDEWIRRRIIHREIAR